MLSRFICRLRSVSLPWLRAMLFGIGLWYGLGLVAADVLAIRGWREPDHDKGMAELRLAMRLMPLDYRFQQYAWQRSIKDENDPLQHE